jgi:capsular exopolysaccharide synthesis family protein
MDVKQYLKAIWGKKEILGYWLIAGVVIAIAAYFIQKPVYLVVSKWFVQKAKSESMFAGASMGSQGGSFAKLAGSFLGGDATNQTEIDAAILQSPDILKEIVKRADLKNQNGELIHINQFKKNFEVKVDKDLPFLILKYYSDNPQEAYNVIKIAEEVFIDKNTTAEAKKAELNRQFLENQVVTAVDDADISAISLKNYEKQAKVVDIDIEAKAQQERLLELENEKATYEANLHSLTTKVADLKRKLALHSPMEAIERSTIGNDSEIISLKTQLSNKTNQLIAYQVKYTDTHHAVKETREEIDNLKKEIEKRQKSLIGKSIPTDKLEDATGVKSVLMDQYVSLSTEQQAVRSRINAINNTLAQYGQTLSVLPSKKFNLTTLEFENEFQKKRLETLKLSLESAKINEAFAKNTISIIKLDETDPPTPERPMKPKYPNIFLNLGIGIFAGLLLGYFNIIIIESLDNKIRNQEQLENLTDAIYLGSINAGAGTDLPQRLFTLHQPNSTNSEEYSKLRTNLKYLKVDIPCKMISLLHNGSAESSAVALTNLAISCAKVGHSVLIVESNLREPLLKKVLAVPKSEKGLTDVLVDNVSDYEQAIINLNDIPNLDFIAAGQLPPNPPDLLDSNKMSQFFDYIQSEYDFVFFNTPDFLEYADALILANKLNANILLAESGVTNIHDFMNMQKALNKNNVLATGTLMLLTEA